jgi:hypothetical protein
MLPSIRHDLEGSGRFKALPQERMPATPARTEEVATAAWKAVGSDYVVVGRVTAMDGGGFAVDFDLINTLTGSRLAGQRFTGSASALRNAAHRTSDVIYQKILGVRGAFATRIAYVAVDGEPPAQTFRLLVADADGANQQRILEYRYPIMSPAWSPDGQWLAYVSFESKHSAVYVQLVRTGERGWSRRALRTCAPVQSPDGKRPTDARREQWQLRHHVLDRRARRSRRSPTTRQSTPNRSGPRTGARCTSPPTAPVRRRSTRSGSSPGRGPSASPSVVPTARARGFPPTGRSWAWSRWIKAITASRSRSWPADRCAPFRAGDSMNRRVSRPWSYTYLFRARGRTR